MIIMEIEDVLGAICVISLVFILIFGLPLYANHVGQKTVRKEAIVHHVAKYVVDPETGVSEFVWIDPVLKEEEK